MLLDAPNIDLHVRDPEADPASTAAHGSSSDLCWDALTFTVRAKSSSGGKTGKQSKHLV